MREIKFRAFDKKNNKMDYEMTFAGNISRNMNDAPGIGDGEQFSELMQFTGLLDKNGNEIYEGDIVDYGNNRFMPVEFIDGAFCICKIPSMPTLITLYEVIGNIHENKELLKT